MPRPESVEMVEHGSDGFRLTESWAFTRGVRVRSVLPVIALWFSVHALGLVQRGLEFEAYGLIPDPNPPRDAPELEFAVDNGFDLIQKSDLIGGAVGWIVAIALFLSFRLIFTYVTRLGVWLRSMDS